MLGRHRGDTVKGAPETASLPRAAGADAVAGPTAQGSHGAVAGTAQGPTVLGRLWRQVTASRRAAGNGRAAAGMVGGPSTNSTVTGGMRANETTLVFHDVPSFRAALELCRTLQAVPGVRAVALADFDRSCLTMRVTGEGDGPTRALLALDTFGLDLEFGLDLRRAEPGRAEFAFRP